MNRFLIRFALIALAFAALQGCDSLYKEDMSDCYAGVSATLRVDPTMTDAPAAEAAAQNAGIYVFDSEGNFLELRETAIGQSELFFYPDAGPLTLVGMINTGSFDVTALDESMRREQATAILKQDGDYSLLPTDLFYGEGALVNASTTFTEEHVDVFAARRTGQATLTVRGLQEYAGIYDNNFHITTHSTGGAMNFYGELLSYGANHAPAATFNTTNEFVTGNFNLMATDNGAQAASDFSPAAAGTPMMVDIWHRDPATGTETLIFSTSTHRDGENISIKNDRTTNILIDFRMGVSIRIEPSEWGVSFPWKTFN